MLRELVQPGYQLTDSHRQQLRDFWCLQHLRTEAISKRSVSAAENMNSDLGLEGDDYRLTMAQAVEMSLGMVPGLVQTISDLKLCLVRNATTLPFVTSDDPAISANRWYQQDSRTRNMSPGLASAGALLFLPITPDILCLFYDGDVYSIRRIRGWANLDRHSDVAAFNEHQYLGAFANVYFHDWQVGNEVGGAFTLLANRRPVSRHEFYYAVLDHVEDGSEIFRQVSAAESRKHQRSILHQKLVHPSPTSWPHLIRFRPDGHVWFNGSGAGYSRRATIPPGNTDYRKLSSRRAR
jgi:hypothetical protein